MNTKDIYLVDLNPTADTLNIRSVSNERLLKKIGTVDELTYQALVKAMRVVLDI